jgi:hypothetical protein
MKTKLMTIAMLLLVGSVPLSGCVIAEPDRYHHDRGYHRGHHDDRDDRDDQDDRRDDRCEHRDRDGYCRDR